MQILNNAEIDMVSGGVDNKTPAQATACANTILFWGGVGSGLGSVAGGFIGFFGGAALGGWFGTTRDVCKTQQASQ
ncbi:hypothetical protein [Massilia sp. LC238]|uniref:hypothetical protein n=1 Tax=Massilia sp. LC238 TaxID=1502852 RepID=UPI001269F8C6|nr:hypothetical protein [Massilia sp. LC238]